MSTLNIKAILIVASCDTKINEINFVKDIIVNSNHRCIILDISTGFNKPCGYDISRDELIAVCGYQWNEFVNLTKAEKLHIITEGAIKFVKKLYLDNKFDGIFGLGGLQNTTVAVACMKQLPIGIPKVVVSTVASGNKTFDPYVGTKDIVLIPSIGDIAGLNTLTTNILSNACGAIIGMIDYAGQILKKSNKIIVGTTLMGVTTPGVSYAINHLKELGIETIGFHSTGTGGRAMEELIESGVIDAAMDLTLHEITSEYFGGGFSYGAMNRLNYLTKTDIPTIISLGGVDFIDFSLEQLPHDIDKRKYIKHNDKIAHIKILKSEAIDIGKIIAGRLNKSKSEVVLLIPTNGLRTDTMEGEILHDKDIDNALIQTVIDNINSHIIVKYIYANFNDKEFGVAAANELYNLLKIRKCI